MICFYTQFHIFKGYKKNIYIIAILLADVEIQRNRERDRAKEKLLFLEFGNQNSRVLCVFIFICFAVCRAMILCYMLGYLQTISRKTFMAKRKKKFSSSSSSFLSFCLFLFRGLGSKQSFVIDTKEYSRYDKIQQIFISEQTSEN